MEIDLKDKVIVAHKGYFNNVSAKKYKENSKDLFQISSGKDHISVIELDLRKSKDGVLYCYHGSFFQYHFSLKIPRNFSYIKNKYEVNSLAEILEVISEDKTIYFDIKDKSVTKSDILSVLNGKKFKDIILGSNSISFLKRFDGMSKFTWGIFLLKFYNFEKLKKDNFKYIDVLFPWQINERVIKKVEKSGMQIGCSPMFMSFFTKKSYWGKVNKYNLKRIHSDFI